MPKTELPIFTLNKREEENASKIEVIKELIFGEQIQEYNSEFEKLKKDILDKKKILETLIAEVRTELDGAISDVSTDINIRITALEESFENKIARLEGDVVEKEMLGKMFTELGKKLSK